MTVYASVFRVIFSSIIYHESSAVLHATNKPNLCCNLHASLHHVLISLSFRSFTVKLWRSCSTQTCSSERNRYLFLERFLVLKIVIYTTGYFINAEPVLIMIYWSGSEIQIAKRNFLFTIRAFRCEFLFFLIHHDQDSMPFAVKSIFCLMSGLSKSHFRNNLGDQFQKQIKSSWFTVSRSSHFK